MFPILPFLAWTGGITAGAQVARGVVRGVGCLVRGQPMDALIQVADGLAAPVRSACEHLAKLGGDVVGTVIGVGFEAEEQKPVVVTSRRRQRRPKHVIILPMGQGAN